MAVLESGHLALYCRCGASVCIGAADKIGRRHQAALADDWRRGHAIGYGEHEEVDFPEWAEWNPGAVDAAGLVAPTGKDGGDGD